jgi:hypothetical protein
MLLAHQSVQKCSFGVDRGGCESQLWSRKCSFGQCYLVWFALALFPSIAAVAVLYGRCEPRPNGDFTDLATSSCTIVLRYPVAFANVFFFARVWPGSGSAVCVVAETEQQGTAIPQRPSALRLGHAVAELLTDSPLS